MKMSKQEKRELHELVATTYALALQAESDALVDLEDADEACEFARERWESASKLVYGLETVRYEMKKQEK